MNKTSKSVYAPPPTTPKESETAKEKLNKSGVVEKNLLFNSEEFSSTGKSSLNSVPRESRSKSMFVEKSKTKSPIIKKDLSPDEMSQSFFKLLNNDDANKTTTSPSGANTKQNPNLKLNEESGANAPKTAIHELDKPSVSPTNTDDLRMQFNTLLSKYNNQKNTVEQLNAKLNTINPQDRTQREQLHTDLKNALTEMEATNEELKTLDAQLAAQNGGKSGGAKNTQNQQQIADNEQLINDTKKMLEQNQELIKLERMKMALEHMSKIIGMMADLFKTISSNLP